jgi:hypothetical protein
MTQPVMEALQFLSRLLECIPESLRLTPNVGHDGLELL